MPKFNNIIDSSILLGCFFHILGRDIKCNIIPSDMGYKLSGCCGDTTYKNSAVGENMEFLKAILGEELYAQLEKKINAHNSDDANKDKQVKIANLGEGGYVSKDKYSALETEKGGVQTQLTEAQKLIEDLKKSGKNDEDLQKKVSDYESRNAQLEAELEQTKIDAAIKVALYGAKATDVDYLLFKLKEKGEEIKLDDKGNVKGIEEMITSLKTQHPNQFDSAIVNKKKIDENKLPNQNDNDGKDTPSSLADAIKQSYENKDE